MVCFKFMHTQKETHIIWEKGMQSNQQQKSNDEKTSSEQPWNVDVK